MSLVPEAFMRYEIVPVTPYQQNATVIWCEKTKYCAFVDPGGEIDRLIAVAEREGLTPQMIILTHGHLDHVGGVAALVERTGDRAERTTKIVPNTEAHIDHSHLLLLRNRRNKL